MHDLTAQQFSVLFDQGQATLLSCTVLIAEAYDLSDLIQGEPIVLQPENPVEADQILIGIVTLTPILAVLFLQQPKGLIVSHSPCGNPCLAGKGPYPIPLLFCHGFSCALYKNYLA